MFYTFFFIFNSLRYDIRYIIYIIFFFIFYTCFSIFIRYHAAHFLLLKQKKRFFLSFYLTLIMEFNICIRFIFMSYKFQLYKIFNIFFIRYIIRYLIFFLRYLIYLKIFTLKSIMMRNMLGITTFRYDLKIAEILTRK